MGNPTARLRLAPDDASVAGARARAADLLRCRALVFGTAVALLSLAGCSSNNDPSSAAAATERYGNLEAPLRPVGSAVSGRVIVVDNASGITLTLNAANLMQGNYRLAFHANPNCKSPNGTSAGPVWGPPGHEKLPGELIPIAYSGMHGEINLSVRIPGVHVDGEPSIRGRSVVLHRGEFVDSPAPGVPNNYVACGVFENLQPSFLDNFAK
jgi:Cu/Zn superoxide dismutase